MKEPSICNYIITDDRIKALTFVLVGAAAGSLIALSANNPDKFLEIVKYPLSDSINFSIAATVGIVITGAICIAILVSVIKNKCQKEESIEQYTYGRVHSFQASVPSVNNPSTTITCDQLREHKNNSPDPEFVLLSKEGSSPSSSDSEISEPVPGETRIPEEQNTGFKLKNY